MNSLEENTKHKKISDLKAVGTKKEQKVFMMAKNILIRDSKILSYPVKEGCWINDGSIFRDKNNCQWHISLIVNDSKSFSMHVVNDNHEFELTFFHNIKPEYRISMWEILEHDSYHKLKTIKNDTNIINCEDEKNRRLDMVKSAIEDNFQFGSLKELTACVSGFFRENFNAYRNIDTKNFQNNVIECLEDTCVTMQMN